MQDYEWDNTTLARCSIISRISRLSYIPGIYSVAKAQRSQERKSIAEKGAKMHRYAWIKKSDQEYLWTVVWGDTTGLHND